MPPRLEKCAAEGNPVAPYCARFLSPTLHSRPLSIALPWRHPKRSTNVDIRDGPPPGFLFRPLRIPWLGYEGDRRSSPSAEPPATPNSGRARPGQHRSSEPVADRIHWRSSARFLYRNLSLPGVPDHCAGTISWPPRTRMPCPVRSSAWSPLVLHSRTLLTRAVQYYRYQ